MDDYDVLFYTDGACEEDPGPCDSGVVVVYAFLNKNVLNFSGYFVVKGTNNIAELNASKEALKQAKELLGETKELMAF